MMVARVSLPNCRLFCTFMSTVTRSPLSLMPVTVPTGIPATTTGFLGNRAAAWTKSALTFL